MSNRMIYAPDMTLRDARKLYFELSRFGTDGGYNERWIKVKLWKIPIWIPNIDNRLRAVKLHDLHHVLTEYPTTWRGEAEISAWELGTGGLRRYWAGWILDLMGMVQGLVINPRGVYRAFMRGRGTTNLFAIEFSDELLDNRVGEFRQKLWLDRPVPTPSLLDYAAFIFWIAIGLVVSLTAVLLVVAPLALIAFVVFL
ncbi:MAG: hypothetical protein WKF34_04885 [Pyrinomonadaceae bacterium]